MTFDAASSELTLAIVGTGAMGRGIAQIAALAGVRVYLFDAAPGAAEQARTSLIQTISALCHKGKVADAQAERAIMALQVKFALEELADAHIVVEAIVERLDAKQALFRQLEAIVPPDTVLATNTSSLSVTAIATACSKPQRVAGYHFFNPVPLMKVVEIIAGLKSAPAVLRSLDALTRRMGHTPVFATDSPGFIVNHAGRGYGTEALKLLGECVGSPAAIDAVLRGQAGFRLGPFELLDLTGLDVSVPVMESIYHQYFEEPRYRPSALVVQRHAAGLLGRKSGEGFYRYGSGDVSPVVEPAPLVRPKRVWVSRAHAEWGGAAADLVHRLGAELDEGENPSPDALCLVTPLGEDVSTAALAQGLDAHRTVGLDMLLGNDGQRVLFLNPLTDVRFRNEAHGLLGSDGASVIVLRDTLGLCTQRVLAHIVNIACDMAQQGIASPQDIDLAVRLGLGYPHGPLTWGDRMGAATVLSILERMTAISGDMRYRPSPWLRRRARLGISLLHPEPALEISHA